MTSEELNEKLGELADREDLAPPALRSTGKCLPYYGWFWRQVDWDYPLRLANANGRPGEKPFSDIPPWIGFCQSNKWGYPMFTVDEAEGSVVRRLCREFAEDPTRERACAIFDYLQGLKPSPSESEPR